MKNPWQTIPLSIYEEHMRLDSVQQLQSLNTMMKDQVYAFPCSSLMILGIAGGNGLEHIQPSSFQKIYGIDINPDYLEECKKRFANLSPALECLCVDLMDPMCSLPKADLLIADLLIEYIGYSCFQSVVKQVSPAYVSCIIQINESTSFVSDSPYLHSFDSLEKVHVQMEDEALTAAMQAISYPLVNRKEKRLPNGKKLIQLDYQKMK